MESISFFDLSIAVLFDVLAIEEEYFLDESGARHTYDAIFVSSPCASIFFETARRT